MSLQPCALDLGTAMIGNGDVRHVIRYIQKWFKKDTGRIGAKGAFNCWVREAGDENAVSWSVYWNTLPNSHDAPPVDGPDGPTWVNPDPHSTGPGARSNKLSSPKGQAADDDKHSKSPKKPANDEDIQSSPKKPANDEDIQSSPKKPANDED